MLFCEYLETCLATDAALSHSKQVEKLALKIYKSLNLTHSGRQLQLFTYGAALHDIGMSLPDAPHNKIGAKFLLEKGLEDLDSKELLIVACLIRYHRGSIPKDTHRLISALQAPDRKTVKIFAAIIRLADALDWKHKSYVNDLNLEITGKKALLTLYCDFNIIIKPGFLKFFSKKKALFERVFGLNVCISLG